MATGTVYFAQEDGGPIKIGHTTGPLSRRLSLLQIGNPRPLKILAAYPGDVFEEQRLHLLFEAERIRGEWFRATHRLVEHVARLKPHTPPPRRRRLGARAGAMADGSLGACLVRANMTQVQLAEALGCDQALVSKWVRGVSFPLTYQSRIMALLPEWKGRGTP
jgi:hypothetical protein